MFDHLSLKLQKESTVPRAIQGIASHSQKIDRHSSPPRFPWVIIAEDLHCLLNCYYTITAFSAYFALTYVLLVLTLTLCFWKNRGKLNGVEGIWKQLKSTVVKYV